MNFEAERKFPKPIIKHFFKLNVLEGGLSYLSVHSKENDILTFDPVK